MNEIARVVLRAGKTRRLFNDDTEERGAEMGLVYCWDSAVIFMYTI